MSLASATGSSIAGCTVGTADLDASAVTTAKLATGAVTTAKLEAGGTGTGVTVTKMADLARGSLISGQASNRPAALDAKGSGKLLIGDGTDVNSVAVTGDVTISNAGVTAIGAGKVLGSMLSTVAKTRSIFVPLGTIATTGATEVIVPIPSAGTLTAVKIVGKDALTTDDTNYLTFALANKSHSDLALLSATATGTTKATGGAAIAAYTERDCPLHASNSMVLAVGDVLAFSATASGTLANTVTEALVRIDYTIST